MSKMRNRGSSGARTWLVAVGVVGALVATTLVGSSLPSSVVEAAPATNVELPPTRLIDTRPGVSPAGVISVPKVKLTPNVALAVTMAGAGGLPAAGVAAAFNLNVTATEANAAGNLAVYPCAEGYQGTSNLNFQAATATSRSSAAVSVAAEPDAAGKVCFRSNQPVHIVVDTFGYLPAGGGYDGVGPFRLLDTRDNSGEVSVPVGRLSPLAELGVKVTGVGGVPASGVEAVLVNLVATAGTSPGFLAAYSCEGGYDDTSNVNFQAGRSRANAAVVPVGSDGRICFLANQPVHVVVDVIGTFAEGSGFTAGGPTRMFDTRTGEGGVPVGKIRLPGVLEFDPFAAGLGLPSTGVTALSLNVVGTRGVAPGFLSVYPCAQGSGGSSTLNYEIGQSVANSIFVPVDSAGKVCFASNQLVDVVVDLTGWFTEPMIEPPVPDPVEVLYRVNAGGPVVASNDDGPEWSADLPASSPSPYVNHGVGNDQAFTVPAGTVTAAGGVPAALFETERFDPVGGNVMEWNFPVTVSGTYQVSLYMSEKYFGVNPAGVGEAGARVFDVAIEDSVVLDDLDLFDQLGPAVGGVFTFEVPVADGAVTIDFTRSIDNPTIDAIEIRSAEPVAEKLSVSRQSVSFGSVVVGESSVESVTLSNLGAAGDPAITGISAAVSGAGISVSSAPAASLQPGESTTVDVTFAPGSVGVVDGSLVVSHSGVNSPVTVDLAGSGVAPPPGERALVEVLPGDTDIDASTFADGSFIVTNQSENGIEVESVVFDLVSAIVPDMVFDPFGTAGDVVAKEFTPNSGAAATGYVGFEYLDPHGGDAVDGFDGLGVDFGDFDPGETFTFSIDLDPTSIQGLSAPGPNNSGGVSGLELAGSSVTVTFSNGAVRTGSLFSDGSNGGAVAVVADGLSVAPALAMPGVAGGTTAVAGQTLEVSGPVGATVTVVHVDSGLFVDPSVSFADPLYANSIVSQVVSTVTLDGSGTASVPVTLRNLGGTAGINRFMAVVESDATAGATSPVLAVQFLA